ncbi:MAG: tRNA preQ1(34) S-adenosylmethionine ribosyltransferase-isomerase QueA [Candidatus Hydrothermarchaeota archaeon]
MRLDEFDYPLPRELIAQRPLEDRSASRLLVLGAGMEHRSFRDIKDYLAPGDLLVVNDTRVVPARLRGRKGTGGRVEALLVRRVGGLWEALVRGKNISPGTDLSFGPFRAAVRGKAGGRFLLEFDEDPFPFLGDVGEVPTPPYIKERLLDGERYQTVYGSKPGSIAAPTAGLHFTPSLVEELEAMGVETAHVTLHIGPGTFTPVRCQMVEDHGMEPEYFEVPEGTAEAIDRREGRLFAVGTTTLKALESACTSGRVEAASGWSDLFIYPPYRFRAPVEGLLTNFHLPRSTLLMLIAAYAGLERVLDAYRAAVDLGYRFYSFGDAMLVFRGKL